MPEELRVIGFELDRVGQRWLELRAQDRRAYADWNRECEARGLPRLDFESVPHEQWLQRAQERNAVPKPGITADEAWDNLHFELLELTNVRWFSGLARWPVSLFSFGPSLLFKMKCGPMRGSTPVSMTPAGC